MISPTRFRRTPSLLMTRFYSDRLSSVTSQVNVRACIPSRRNEALGFRTTPRFESGYSGNKYRRVNNV
jgi:hypothetical protein